MTRTKKADILLSKRTVEYVESEVNGLRLQLALLRAQIRSWQTARKAAISTPNPNTFSALADAEYTMMHIKGTSQ